MQAQEENNLSRLDKKWELVPEAQKGTLKLSEYRPLYLMPFRWVNNPNDKPESLSENNITPEPFGYNHTEIKFQLSLKTKILQNVLGNGRGDVWVAFTQVSDWQAYNSDLSRTFRELNYEPELIFNYPLYVEFGEFKIKMVSLGFSHQSNGKNLPESRSWNRLNLSLGMEMKRLTLMAKTWYRLPEKASSNDNPKIESYVGRAELSALYENWGQEFYLKLRSNMSFSNYRGSTEFNWLFPVKNDLKIFLSFTNGYGDSLIDYNWNQTTFGIGVSMGEWL